MKMLIFSLGLFLCCQQVISQQNAKEKPTMSLKYFKASGLYQAMANRTEYVNLFLSNYRSAGTSDNAVIDFTKESRMTFVANQDVADLERAELSASAKHAGCNPYDQVVTVPNDKSNVLIYPSCIVLKQCGGCCGHPSLACRPLSTQTKTIQILKYIYDGKAAHPSKMVDFVQMQEHTSCECQCKLTEADCTPALHYFDDWECKCMCRKPKTSCSLNTKWDDNLCACRCASVQNCGRGYEYDMITCRCKEISARNGDNTGNAVEESNNEVSQTTTTAPCGHVRCGRRYKPALSLGTCVCRFNSNSG